MKFLIRIPLKTNRAQAERLASLQRMFAEACNVIVDIAVQHRCWNRVTLHHMTYRMLRERFPELGSQMACNVIYSVSRSCRRVFQNPSSPFALSKLGSSPLPQISFKSTAPVYFDRHTLSIKEGQLSMYALDGRIRFKIDITPDIEQRFHEEKLREIVLSVSDDQYVLSFHFQNDEAVQAKQSGKQPDDQSEHLIIKPESQVTVRAKREARAA